MLLDKITRAHFENLWSPIGELCYEVKQSILRVTDERASAYEVWEDLVEKLVHQDIHQRAIAAQVVSNLAKSDSENRMLNDFEALLTVTKDEKFNAARHILQPMSKVGLAGKRQRQMVVDALVQRFNDCRTETSGSPVRSNILEGLHKPNGQTVAQEIKDKALASIDSEEDEKCRKKDVRLWKDG